MKLNFDSKIDKLITSIVFLPNTEDNGYTEQPAFKMVNQFIQKLDSLNKASKIQNKDYAKIRRQMSFINNLLKNSRKEAIIYFNRKGIVKPDPKDVKQKHYQIFVRLIKDVHSGIILKDPWVIQDALNYGVLFLTIVEIKCGIDKCTASSR